MGNLVKFAGIIAAFVISLVTGQTQTLHKIRYERPSLGSKAVITCYAEDSSQAQIAIDASFALLDSFDNIFSDYKSTSECSRLAMKPANEWIAVSDPMYDLMEKAQQISHETDGRFTILIGALSQLWRAHLAEDKIPKKAAIRRARKLTKSKYLQLAEGKREIKKGKRALRFDFGGIAKGYIADHMAQVLTDHNLPIFLIDLGGDLVAGAPPPNETGWNIAISWCETKIAVSQQAIATSGPDYQFFIHKGIQYAHIIDPSTGWGVPHHFATTVLAPDGWRADALASALSILPLKKSQEILQEKPDIAYIIGAGNELLTSENFFDYRIN